ncbi:MAG: hypothetical protein L6V93_11250 [Clostridiales bacterium]|nr:MAG: hypothetical protein L6V93_11250 [Clostridiales bacterium]
MPFRGAVSVFRQIFADIDVIRETVKLARVSSKGIFLMRKHLKNLKKRGVKILIYLDNSATSLIKTERSIFGNA